MDDHQNLQRDVLTANHPVRILQFIVNLHLTALSYLFTFILAD